MKQLLTLLFIAPAHLLFGTTYYVGPNGNNNNDGTTNRPFATIQYACNLGPSNTIIVFDGAYTNTTVMVQRPWTTIKALNKWKAMVVSTNIHGIYADNVDGMTVDGMVVAHAPVDGIKFASLIDPNGHHGTVKNCWIYDCGLGDYSDPEDPTPNTGQGIAAHSKNYMLFENNLIEKGGRWRRHDHCIYSSGHHIVIRNNVFREWLAFAIQIYENSPYVTYEMDVYNNLAYNCGRGFYFQTMSNTNTIRIYNNTIICTNTFDHPILMRVAGNYIIRNNIVIGTGNRTIGSDDVAWSGIINEDYNIGQNPVNLLGINDQVFSYAQLQFANTNIGQYWLKSTSPAKAAGNGQTEPAANFWNQSQDTADYVGAFPYFSEYETDVRTLDPSDSILGAPYWNALNNVAPPPLIKATEGVVITGGG